MWNFIKQYKWWIIGALVIVAIVIYRHRAAMRAEEAAETASRPNNPSPAPSETAAAPAASKEAKMGQMY